MSWADSVTITGSVTIDADAIRGAVAEAKLELMVAPLPEWQAKLRRELSPMFGWVPMPIAWVTVGALRVPLERVERIGDDLLLTAWRYWDMLDV
jgi:hypothetical protein